jgi:methionyl-tRNA formyltransferase
MNIVVLTNGATHGRRILEGLKAADIRASAVVLEVEAAYQRPPLRTCLEQFGYTLTAKLLYRDLRERLFPNHVKWPYQKFADVVHVVGNLNSPESCRVVRGLAPDLIILGGSRILKGPILECARIAVLNAHPGLLPDYRGNDVIAWAIWNGDPVGVTVHVVDAGVDTGSSILRQELEVRRGDSLAALKGRAEQLAAALMTQAVVDIVGKGKLSVLTDTKPRGPLYRAMSPELRAQVEKKLAASGEK